MGYEVTNPSTADELFDELVDDLTPKDDGRSDIEDTAPREFKAAVYQQARQYASSGQRRDVPLDQFVRRSLDSLWSEKKLAGHINVGENRHFPRIWQWLSEVAQETEWGYAHELKIMNASRRGKVRSDPSSPQGLIVRIDPDYIRSP